MHTKQEPQEPIRRGDKFKNAAGHVWEVQAVLPGGLCSMKRVDRMHFGERYTRDIRTSMTRVNG